MSVPIHANPRGVPQQILATVWQRNLPLVRQRVQVIRNAAETLQRIPLTADTRLEAASTAHKLAGSLGMFGFPAGSEIAHQLEVLLDGDAPLAAEPLHDLALRLEASVNL